MAKVETDVPSFPTVDLFVDALQKKSEFKPGDFYFRDGLIELAILEEQFAGLIGAKEDQLLLYNSGMSAVVEALEYQPATHQTKIVYGDPLYSQSGIYITRELHNLRGAKAFGRNPSSLPDLEKILNRVRPEIICLETVGNGPEMPVLDIEGFLSLPILAETEPLIILDNTLPTPTTLPLAKIMETSPLRIIAVESGTKFYARNKDSCGFIHTRNEKILQRLKERRRTTGSLITSPDHIAHLAKIIPKSKEEFDSFNRQTLSNTFRLAMACHSAESDKSPFVVTHPNLPNHPDSDYANLKFPFGASPVFFISLTEPNRFNQIDLIRALWEHPTVRELCDLGQSFGFERPRILINKEEAVVRIAGGTENADDNRRLQEAFKERLSAV